MRFMMNERARTCAHIEYDDDLYMSLSVHKIAPLSVCIACFCIGTKSGSSSGDDDDVVIA